MKEMLKEKKEREIERRGRGGKRGRERRGDAEK